MNILGVVCAAHLIHNALKTSADKLPVEVEPIINKIFQHFRIFTVRVEELKKFCNFVEVEYKPVLGSVKTRWLSLLPVLERTIEMFDGLRSYFLSQEKSPKFLRDFFNDPQSILYLRFIHSQIKLCTNTIKKIEEEDIWGSEVAEELRMLKDHIFNRKEQQFFTSAILEIKSQLVEDGLITEVEFAKVVDNFYNTFLEYIQDWGKRFEDLHHFNWPLLNDAPSWHED